MMDLIESRAPQIRRATVGRSALTILAWLFLGASLTFWAVLHWTTLVIPGTNGLPQAIVAVVMTLIYAFALPLLLSMLVPTTPAGMLLQKTQWRTLGFPVIVGAAAYLGWHAKTLMLLWFSAQPVVHEADQEVSYTIACLIGFVVIPALAWVQATPEQWLAQIQQAHLVKKLQIEQASEIAILRGRLEWVKVKTAHSYYQLLPREQQEVRDTLRGLFMSIADDQRAIVQTLSAKAEVQRDLRSLGDQEIAETFDHLATQLAKPADQLTRALTIDADVAEQPHVDSRPGSAESREVHGAPRSATQHGAAPRTMAHDPEIDVVRRELTSVWTAKELAAVLKIEQRTAQETIAAWKKDGRIREIRLGRYSLTESEA